MGRPKKVTTEGVEAAVAQEATTSASAPTESAEKVEVKRDTLEALLARVETLEKASQEKDNKISMLESVADVNRIARWESQNGKRIVPKARVTFWEGQPVVGWKTVKDEVRLVGNQVIANQVIKIYTQDPEGNVKEADLDYVQFQRSCQSSTGEVVSKEDSVEDGNTYYSIVMPDGRKIRLDIRFINAW